MAALTIDQALQAAMGLHQAGNLAAAENLYRQILAVQPNHADALHLLGAAALTSGRPGEAIDLISRALVISPSQPVYLSNLGEAHRRLGHLDEAIAYLRRAVALEPHHGDILNNLGTTLAQTGQYDEAAVCLERILELRGEDVATLNHLALIRMRQGYAAKAADYYLKALALSPSSAEASNNLGHAYVHSRNWDEAIAHCQRALELKPDLPQACGNLALAFLGQGRREEAIACNERGLAIQPGSAELRNNLAMAHLECGHYQKALQICEQALAVEGDFAPAHWSHSLMLLRLRRFEEGWREHEWRWKSPPLSAYRRHFPVPQWDGVPVPGQTILAHAEQGYGDAIQFLRYVLLLQERVGREHVLVECARPLVEFFAANLGPAAKVFPRETWDGHELPAFDAHIPWHTLPLALGVFDPVPMGTPYLRADPALCAEWRERLGRGTEFRVGLAWTGNPDFVWDHYRSIAPGKYLPLLKVPGIRFYSLQVQTRNGPPAALLDAGLIDLTGQITDFSDTAALVAGLDLIISTDGVTVHLAGAMGKPVWALLPFVPDWRWALEREDTAWYPTARLFRQRAIADWDAVLQQVEQSLRAAV